VTFEKREGRTRWDDRGDVARVACFDVGSTMLMMPFVIDEMFELAGTQTDHEIEMMPIEPM
jgi:hypothetical protein